VSPKKILIITPYYEPVKGGITTFARMIKKEFRKMKNSVLVITQRGQQKDDVISIERKKFIFIFKSYLSIRKYKPDIIQCFSQWQILSPAILYKLTHPKVKVIFTYNTEILENVGFFKKKTLSWLVSRCDSVTFVSKYLMTEIEKKIKIRTKKRVIYDGCPLNPNYSDNDVMEFKKKYKINNDNGPVISAIAVFAYKLKVDGLKRLIMAFKGIVDNYPKAKLIIVGDGQYKNDIVSQINKLDISENVILTGYMNNVFIPLTISDIYTHITLQEAGVAITILEAWALEKPVIVSNIGGIPEVVTNNVNGIIIEPSPIEITKSITDLYENKEKMKNMGKEGKARYSL
jgi:glycosyltransferase involved in cell wall biosynthesis